MRAYSSERRFIAQVKHKNETLQKQKLLAYKKANQILDLYEGSTADLMNVESELLLKTCKAKESINQEQKTGASHLAIQDGTLASCNLQTKDGNKTYSQLYYSLLAEQISPAKISKTITAVLNCFLPSVDTSSLQ